ncbi:MAG: hypothetical protein WC626_06370 [Methanoregula sp.]
MHEMLGDDKMKKVVLISGHHIQSKRKAGFHWLAYAFSNKNWDIVFITAPIRYSAWFLGDHRTQCFSLQNVNQPEKIPNSNITSYVFMTLLNPISSNNKFFKYLSSPLIKLYGRILPKNLKFLITNADIIIFESTEALLLFEKFRELNPDAKYIYRVSDLLEVNNTPQFVIEYEKKIAPMFDLISVPSEYIFKKFNYLPNTRLHYHGINKELFATKDTIPEEYTQFEKNIIFVGTTHFDSEFIKIAAGLFPQWGFHIIGPLDQKAKSPNIMYYGEISFNETIPYLKYADVGLQTRKSAHGLASLSDSLKVLQYTYCKLPIIAPIGLNSSRKNFIYYIPGNLNSILIALNNAVAFNRSDIETSDIHSWNELVELLIDEIFKTNKSWLC